MRNMSKSIKLFSLLTDENHLWFLESSSVKYFKNHELVFSPIESRELHILIRGHACYKVYEKKSILYKNIIKPGYVVGIDEFLGVKDRKGYIECRDDVVTLSIPYEKIEEKIQKDKDFAFDFYKAISILIAEQSTVEKSHSISLNKKLNESKTSIFLEFDKYLSDFSSKILSMHKAFNNKYSGHDYYHREYQECYQSLAALSNFCDKHIDNASRKIFSYEPSLHEYISAKLLPYFLLSDCASLCLSSMKYPADLFNLYKKIHNNKPSGYGIVGKMIDDFFLHTHTCRLVRLRSKIYAGLLQTKIKEDEKKNIALVSSFPPIEISLVTSRLKNQSQYYMTQYIEKKLLSIAKEYEFDVTLSNLLPRNMLRNIAVKCDLIVVPEEGHISQQYF